MTHCIQAAAVERPPWPSASFPSVKALAGFVKRRRQHAASTHDTRAIVCVVTYVRRYKGSARETVRTFLNVLDDRALSTYIYIDEKLTPRDLSTDNIVLKCISHRSIAGHYVKSILLYVDNASARPVALIYLRASINLYRVFGNGCVLSTYLTIFLVY